MLNYYCKNCNNIIGKWDTKYKQYDCSDICNNIESKNIYSIHFLDCINCNKFVGIICFNICENCFGENEIIGEENLFNWFLKYKKIITSNYNYLKPCNVCNTGTFRSQCWFFEELAFYK